MALSRLLAGEFTDAGTKTTHTKADSLFNEHSESEILRLTAQIVSAHVAKNALTPEALPALIQTVHRTLSNVGVVQPEPEKPQPAVPIRKSVFADYLVCLEDGKKLKMLKRHLATSYDMTPDQYRERWELPRDYPMVAPNYAQQRSSLAKQIGLGRKPAEAAPAEAVVEVAEKPTRRGRKPKAAAGTDAD